MEIGVYLEKFSDPRDFVAWDNLIFFFGDGVDDETIETIEKLFRFYRSAYFKRESECGRSVWKESFSTSIIRKENGRGIEIDIIPYGEDAAQFAGAILRTISRIKNHEDMINYLKRNTDINTATAYYASISDEKLARANENVEKLKRMFDEDGIRKYR